MKLQNFRSILRDKLREQKLTLTALSQQSDLSEDTLRSIIYGKSQDIKLSTLVKIADVLQCSIDELINRSAYSPSEQYLMSQIHKLPERSLQTIRIIVTLEEKRTVCKSGSGKEIIPVFLPKGSMRDGMYYDGSLFDSLDITEYPNSLKHETDFGLRIQTSNYEPCYYPNDILLFSQKQSPHIGDIVMYISIDGKIYIRKYTELGLEPINSFGKLISRREMQKYTALGVVLKTVNEFDIEQYR